MKRFGLIILLIAVSISTSFAQLEEGHIAYSIDVSSDDPEAGMMIGMFDGSTMNLYFDNDFTRTEIDFGSLVSLTTVINSQTNEVMILQGGMMGQRGTLTTSEDMNADSLQDTKFTVSYEKGSKKILGYKCKRAIVTDENGVETYFWYTEKIKAMSTDGNSAVSQLPGLALEYVALNDGMKMTFTATIVEDKLDEETKASKLSLTIPDGYEVLSYEEFSEAAGGI